MKSSFLAFSAVLVVSAATVAPASAQDAGAFFQNILGSIGVMPRERESIDYRQRAPLVVPPKMELPAPLPPGAARNAAWPVDPDVVARREAARNARKPVGEGKYGHDIRDARLTPEQLRANRVAPGPGGPGGYGPMYGDRGQVGTIMNPTELRKVTSKADEPALAPGELPRRRQLTDPPGTLRKATEFVAPKSEPVERSDEADPKKFIREEALRR